MGCQVGFHIHVCEDGSGENSNARAYSILVAVQNDAFLAQIHLQVYTKSSVL